MSAPRHSTATATYFYTTDLNAGDRTSLFLSVNGGSDSSGHEGTTWVYRLHRTSRPGVPASK